MNEPLKFEIPEGTEPARCRGCKAVIFWIKTERGRNMPVDPDGTSHFANCPDADRFRNAYHPDRDPRRPEQNRQYSKVMERFHKLTPWEQKTIKHMAPKFERNKELTKTEASALRSIAEKLEGIHQ